MAPLLADMVLIPTDVCFGSTLIWLGATFAFCRCRLASGGTEANISALDHTRAVFLRTACTLVRGEMHNARCYDRCYNNGLPVDDALLALAAANEARSRSRRKSNMAS